MGYSLIVNVTPDIPFPKYPCEYIRVDVFDVGVTSQIKKMVLSFPKVTNSIKSAVDKGLRVLVHCNEGQQRSPTVLVAFLMDSKGYSVEEGMGTLVEMYPRAFSDGPPRFYQALQVWEMDIRNQT